MGTRDEHVVWMRWSPLIVLFVPLLLVTRTTIAGDSLVAALVVAMAALVSVVRRLAARGERTRTEVRRIVQGMLAMLFAVPFMGAYQLGVVIPGSSFDVGIGMLILVLGWLPLAAMDGRFKFGWIAGLGAFLVVGLNVGGVTFSSEASVARKLERLHLDPASHGALVKAWVQVSVLDALGHGDKVDRRAEDLRGLLSES